MMAKVGRWIRAFQAADVPDGRVSIPEIRDYIDLRLVRLVQHRRSGVVGSDRERILQHIDSLGRVILASDLTRTMIHADLALGNILVNGARVVVLDFSMVQLGSRLHDLTRLCLQVEFLGAPVPSGGGYEPVFTHDDLGIEHVLADPSTWAVTGVIDWTDAAVTDPARDFGRILRDLGPAALEAALTAAGRPADGSLRDRAVAYARCGVLEDLAFGLSTGRPTYTGKSLAALGWLFPS